MSCIKFPSSKIESSKSSTKENINDYAVINSHLIAIANQVFGEGNWSHGITCQTLDFIDYITGKYQAGCVSIVRVQLKDGTFHEDIGYSNTEGSTKGSAIQKARMSSFNSALKKALKCFGSELTNKINKLSSRPSSPVPIEQSQNKFLQMETVVPIVSNKIVKESFEEPIPMSQTDALINIVDLDKLFDKDQNSNTVNILKKEEKKDLSKLISDKDKTSNNINKEVCLNVLSTNTEVNILTDKNNKSNTVDNIKKETKIEIPKIAIPTAMTEEEMRLERKRKQKEMHEEFKRKEEFKKRHGDNGSKLIPNPRY